MILVLKKHHMHLKYLMVYMKICVHTNHLENGFQSLKSQNQNKNS